jgi:seryl-tRNA synthetase
VVENYQQADGSIFIPKALHKYFGSLKVIPHED